MNGDKQNIKTTDWLTRGIPEEQLKREKREAIREAEAELRNKQIEEMAMVICENSAISCYETAEEIAEELTAKGYRKASEFAEEIFAEIDKQIAFFRMYMFLNKGVKAIVDTLAELKKKYESEKDK